MKAINESVPDYWRQHHPEIITLVAALTPESALAVLRFTTQECNEGAYLTVHLLTNLRWIRGRQDAMWKVGAQ